MSYIWISQLKKIKIIIQKIMTKLNSILKPIRKDIIFIIKLLAPKISIININISYELKVIIVYIVINLIYILFKRKK